MVLFKLTNFFNRPVCCFMIWHLINTQIKPNKMNVIITWISTPNLWLFDETWQLLFLNMVGRSKKNLIWIFDDTLPNIVLRFFNHITYHWLVQLGVCIPCLSTHLCDEYKRPGWYFGCSAWPAVFPGHQPQSFSFLWSLSRTLHDTSPKTTENYLDQQYIMQQDIW